MLDVEGAVGDVGGAESGIPPFEVRLSNSSSIRKGKNTKREKRGRTYTGGDELHQRAAIPAALFGRGGGECVQADHLAHIEGFSEAVEEAFVLVAEFLPPLSNLLISACNELGWKLRRGGRTHPLLNWRVELLQALVDEAF
jgi:hypothetical protein